MQRQFLCAYLYFRRETLEAVFVDRIFKTCCEICLQKFEFNANNFVLINNAFSGRAD